MVGVRPASRLSLAGCLCLAPNRPNQITRTCLSARICGLSATFSSLLRSNAVRCRNQNAPRLEGIRIKSIKSINSIKSIKSIKEINQIHEIHEINQTNQINQISQINQINQINQNPDIFYESQTHIL
jgi:hypothetical protein